MLLNNFPLKNFFFGARNIIKNSDKIKYLYSGYGIAFHGLGSWSFGNDFAGNAEIFGVANSSWSLTKNHINKFLVLYKGPTNYINGSIGGSEKNWY